MVFVCSVWWCGVENCPALPDWETTLMRCNGCHQEMSNYAFFVKYTYSNECALLAYNFHELVSKLQIFDIFAYRHDHRLISVTLAYILYRYQVQGFGRHGRESGEGESYSHGLVCGLFDPVSASLVKCYCLIWKGASEMYSESIWRILKVATGVLSLAMSNLVAFPPLPLHCDSFVSRCIIATWPWTWPLPSSTLKTCGVRWKTSLNCGSGAAMPLIWCLDWGRMKSKAKLRLTMIEHLQLVE